MKLEPKYFIPGNSREKVGKETPPDTFIMDNLETLLATTVEKARGNSSGDIVERFNKPRVLTLFGHPEYSLDGSGTLIAVSGPHEEFSTVILVYS